MDTEEPQTQQTMSSLYGEIYGGLLLDVNDQAGFKPIEFPFDSLTTSNGNHVKTYDPQSVNSFDFWHGHRNCEAKKIFVAERGLSIDGLMIGNNADSALRTVIHQVLTINVGVKVEDRGPMLDMMTSSVLPKITESAFVSLEIQSSQPKFILFSRDIPVYMNVFCDDTAMMLVWSNESQLEQRMRHFYGNRFVVYRLNPLVNSACVIHTFYLKKKINRWKYELKDRLKILNALEGSITRRSKSDTL